MTEPRDAEPDPQPSTPSNPRQREASTLDGQRTRAAAEQAELERLTGRPTVDAPDADAPAEGDDTPYRSG